MYSKKQLVGERTHESKQRGEPTMVRLPALHHHYFYRDSAVVTFPKASRLDRRATRIVGQNKAGRGALQQKLYLRYIA